MTDYCKKCGEHSVGGPTYESDVYGERLRYRCRRCGYTYTGPTADAKQEAR